MKNHTLISILLAILFVLTACATPTSATPPANATPAVKPVTSEAVTTGTPRKGNIESVIKSCVSNITYELGAWFKAVSANCLTNGAVRAKLDDVIVQGSIQGPASVNDGEQWNPSYLQFDQLDDQGYVLSKFTCSFNGIRADISKTLTGSCENKAIGITIKISFDLKVKTTTHLMNPPIAYPIEIKSAEDGKLFLACGTPNRLQYWISDSNQTTTSRFDCRAGILLNKTTMRMLVKDEFGDAKKTILVKLKSDGAFTIYEPIYEWQLVPGRRYIIASIDDPIKYRYLGDEAIKNLEIQDDSVVFLGKNSDGTFAFNSRGYVIHVLNFTIAFPNPKQ